MDQATANINAMLEELKLRFSLEQVEPDLIRYDIQLEDVEDLQVTGLLYQTDGGTGFRLMCYIDDLSEDQALAQLKLLMALNGELPMGAFCMDPEEGAVFMTLNARLEDLNAEGLGECFEYLLLGMDIYDQEFYPGGGDGASLDSSKPT